MTSEPKITLREGLVDKMRNRFDEQLLQLDNELITMGALCEEAISNAVKYLTTDDEYKSNAIESDRQIDRKERDIENLCMKLLLMQQPVAKDLRKISSALKMISDMERIGDQASDISEIAHFVNSAGYVNKIHITDMTAAAIKMVTDSIDSFVKSNENLAQNVIEQDELVSRVNALLRRTKGAAARNVYQVGTLFVHPGKHVVKNGAQTVTLSFKEYTLLTTRSRYTTSHKGLFRLWAI